MTTSPTQTHDARHANRRLLVEQIRNDGLDAVLARMTGEEFKEFKVFVVAALLGKLDNQSTSPNVEAPRAWNDVSSVQTEELRMPEERAWVIEMPSARWGTGFYWIGVAEYGEWGTIDKAVRFTRKVDAENVIASLHIKDKRAYGYTRDDKYEACEHIWSEPTCAVSPRGA